MSTVRCNGLPQLSGFYPGIENDPTSLASTLPNFIRQMDILVAAAQSLDFIHVVARL
ncbi:hypothetical protein [uncultured Ornithinimicrobium sp.]|uniref:hypothetical protein n=1 Tax=uncultured Ornithinimicrobium sp. TaxID=259307 RepID=UPI0025955F69|nr:hypothetical protein [uncultured Ornithinimicrobium sp.]